MEVHLWPHAGVPACVVAGPQLQMSRGHQWVKNMVLIVYKEGVCEVLGLADRGAQVLSDTGTLHFYLILCGSVLPVNVGPKGDGLTLHLLHKIEEVTLAGPSSKMAMLRCLHTWAVLSCSLL